MKVRAGEALRRIIKEVGQIDGLVSDMAATAREQVSTLSEVSKAVVSMDQATQFNAEMVGRTSAGTRALDARSRHLLDMVGAFAIAGDDDDGPSAATPRSRATRRSVA
jgi:methyl-accepting chemotaxis protein